MTSFVYFLCSFLAVDNIPPRSSLVSYAVNTQRSWCRPFSSYIINTDRSSSTNVNFLFLFLTTQSRVWSRLALPTASFLPFVLPTANTFPHSPLRFGQVYTLLVYHLFLSSVLIPVFRSPDYQYWSSLTRRYHNPHSQRSQCRLSLPAIVQPPVTTLLLPSSLTCPIDNTCCPQEQQFLPPLIASTLAAIITSTLTSPTDNIFTAIITISLTSPLTTLYCRLSLQTLLLSPLGLPALCPLPFPIFILLPFRYQHSCCHHYQRSYPPPPLPPLLSSFPANIPLTFSAALAMNIHILFKATAFVSTFDTCRMLF